MDGLAIRLSLANLCHEKLYDAVQNTVMIERGPRIRTLAMSPVGVRSSWLRSACNRCP